METVVIAVMVLVAVSFVLRMSTLRLPAMAAIVAVVALVPVFVYDFASTQSKTQIADWLSQPQLMLDTAVVLTLDVFIQLAFCILMVQRLGGDISRRGARMLAVAELFPGLLIFPVVFALLVELLFVFPGVSFAATGIATTGALAIVLPLAAIGARWLLPEAELRLELIFLINLLIAALGIIATVNGRTAAAGTTDVDWAALVSVLALLAAGVVAGIIISKIKTRKQLR